MSFSTLKSLWLRVQGSLWFVPAIMLAGCMVLAVALVEIDGHYEPDLADRWPRLFGAGADGARAMLSAIATSVITVAGVVFSVTIVALSLASTQYSPRVLRSFMSDRPTQVVMGTFVGIFVYCLMVLRTVRAESDADPGFVPPFAVMGGLVLAILGVAMLVYFIHHVVDSIQATSILERIADETSRSIDHLFPEPVAQPLPSGKTCAPPPEGAWIDVPGARTGYLLGVDADALLEVARESDCVVALVHPVGSFLIEGRPALRVAGAAGLDEARRHRLAATLDIGRQRDVRQDAPYGLQQLVDVALRALSPSLNDPTTAVHCLDRIGALLVRLADRNIPSPCRFDGDTLRLVLPGPGFEDMTALALDPLARHARGEAAFLGRLLEVLELVAGAARDDALVDALRRRLDTAARAIARSVEDETARARLLARSAELAQSLARPR
jgi:uncharacterized membrane protein